MTTFNSIKVSIANQLKQDIINISCNELDNYIQFKNNGMECFLLTSFGSYSVVYDRTSDQVIIAWCLKLELDNNFNFIGSWGQGYYFPSYPSDDIIAKYDLRAVSELFAMKAWE